MEDRAEHFVHSETGHSVFLQAEWQAATDVGLHREHNEDAYRCLPTLGLYVVCDGMGGHAAGEVASQLAAETATLYIQEATAALKRQLLTPSWIKELLEKAILYASEMVYQAAQKDPAKRGMGTTLTMMWLAENRAYVGHVGDSRAYMLRKDESCQLTEDHTLVHELYKLGRLTEEQMADFPFKNALSRSIGLYPSVQVDIVDFDILPGDVFVLCSDGLHNYFVGDKKLDVLESLLMPESVEKAGTSDVPSHGVQELIDFAKSEGGHDNITAIVICVPESQETLETLRTRSTMQILKGLALLEGLSPKEYMSFLNVCQSEVVQEGELIFRQGEQGGSLRIIVEGLLVVKRDGIELTTLREGEHFGELALLDHLPRFADVEAKEETHLIKLTRDDFEGLLLNEPALGVKLLRNVLNPLTRLVRSQSERILDYESASAIKDTLALESFAVMEREAADKTP